MRTFFVWSALSAGFFCLLTYLAVRLWDHRIGQEVREAQRLANAVEVAARRQQEIERRSTEEIAQSERRYKALAEAGATAVWRADESGRLVALQGWTALTGQSDEMVLGDKHGWLHGLHPDDRETAAAAWTLSLQTGEPYQAAYRVRVRDGADWRWCASRGVTVRGQPDADHHDGRIVEWVGVVYDTDAQRRAEEQWRLVAMEVNHRAKNTLAVVQTMVHMGGDADKEATEKLSARIRSLARAHDLLAKRDWRDTDLRTVIETELNIFEHGLEQSAFRLTGPVLLLAAGTIQSITLVLHELATNAAKYGALAHHGRIDIQWSVDAEHLRLCWAEIAGSVMTMPTTKRGFGTRVIDSTIKGQLGGTIERRWEPTGLNCDIRLPLARLQFQQAKPSAVPPPPPLSVAG